MNNNMIINIAKLNKELTAVRLERDEAVKLHGSHQEEKHNLEEQIRKLAEEKIALESKLANFKVEEAAVIVATNDSVNEKVVQKLASMGVQEGTVPDTVATAPDMNSVNDVYTKYRA